ncbi:hypothetical protein [Botrimarina sp.]|uniref:hypothetical protein n=1 Tax=Botrimarina sp. TaxID=2795802 RepID=UPI0032EAD1E1
MNRRAASPLPLPLTPFEAYMVRDDRPGYPMVFPFGFRFRGEIQRAALQAAWSDTVAEEPLLSARVERRHSGWRWVEANEPPPLQWRDLPEAPPDGRGRVPVQPIDLRTGPAARLVVEAAPGGATVIGYFHHAAADGLGAKRVLCDLFARYGQITGDPEGLQTPPPDPAKLARRADVRVAPPEPVSSLQVAKTLGAETYKWLARRPQPLASARAIEPGGTSVTLWRRLPEGVLPALRGRAADLGVTVNDLLLRDLLRLLAERISASGAGPGSWLRVLVPTDLRRRWHAGCPAANIFGYAFLTRSLSQCGPSRHALLGDGSLEDGLLTGISEEMRTVKYWSLGTIFLDALKLFHAVPGLLAATASPRLCHATSVLSNVGALHVGVRQARFRRDRTIRVGGLVLQDVFAAPPVRPGTAASFLVALHAGGFNLCMGFDPNALADDEANGLLDAYAERLRATAGSGAAAHRAIA